MDIVELFSTAHAAEKQQGREAAISLYQEWVKANPDDPTAHAAWFNLGSLQLAVNDNQGALFSFNEAVRLKPDFMPGVISLGSALERIGQVDLALQYWEHAAAVLANVSADTINYKVTVLKQMARVRQSRQESALAEDVLRSSLEVAPYRREEMQHWANVRQRQCKWPVLQSFGSVTPAQITATLAPLTLAYFTDDPILSLANAYSHSRHDIGWPEIFKTSADFKHRRRATDGRLRIGYLSSDLRNHAIGHLTVEMFGLHDRSRVEVTAFYCGVKLEDDLMRRIRASVDHWHDVSDMDDATAAALVEECGIDILVDINGNTRDARTSMLARRPAPVIVNWLGYPGTMGSPYHHYIIADPVIIPPGSERYYTERVARVPCYQPNDRHRVISPLPQTRAQHGLPETGMVFCCFNGQQKMTRFNMARWLEILKRVDGSVLWLLRGSDEGDSRIREEAVKAGIDPARLIFAPYAANADHLARYVLADLFLDSSPYGAHTTASDALWMGVPVLTVPGRGFPSRVCASLVTAAGMPEFVCDSPQAYVEEAVRLGQDPAALSAAKAKLLDLRHRSVLFDTNSFARSMEDAFDRMWAEWEAGDLPVPDLTNLDLYLDIGSAMDHDAEEFGFLPDYEERYRSALARRHALTPVPWDQRLWTKPA